MKNLHYVLILSVTFMCCSCAPVAYLPTSDKIGEYQYGSYIHIRTIEKTSLKGELIAVNAYYVYLLNNNAGRRLDSVAREQITDFKIKFANSNTGLYAASIPLSALVTITHGFYLVFTLPLNVITTSIVAIDAGKAFEISKNSIRWDDLSMYARFPQGIPANVRKQDIR
jgi:hypothetical protein